MQSIETMTDDQLKTMIEQLKANKEMAKQAFAQKQGGQQMSDEQLDMMLGMMSPEMLRMSTKMAKENPQMGGGMN